MSEADTDSPTPGSGAWLTAARERAGWSLVQAAEQLHLDVATVKALEAGQLESLGASVYARGHLRRYVELLGLPVSELDRMYAQAPRREPDLTRTTSMQNTAGRGGALHPLTAVVVTVIIVVLALVWWALRVPHHAHVAPLNSTATPGKLP